ncbi:GNAT family N-acetyltransferase [Spirochaeta cellobiosiphila]|uniref:GNAT family N-acetyltransferase n=1 Tax=Spirochaeta cellobiosiphila TaxID=504483 RepID=UPI0004125291|nr:GNAT family N-acetyltransferase [Spirochaeta cellobiosiphila]
MLQFTNITKENLDTEHICCAFSDKKCTDSYQLKKEWLKEQLSNGYVFYRLNERAKVFIEYGPAEKAWLPIIANNYLNINCFWVSGKYKGKGLGKKLLNQVENAVGEQKKDGIVTVAGKKKFHFMSDGKWFQKQGFSIVDETKSGFLLLEKKITTSASIPVFAPEATEGTCPEQEGLVIYYSNRCPYSEYHIRTSFVETAKKRGIPFTIHKLETLEQAQKAPSPATIFSLFYNGKFVTTDLSVCMDSRFDKLWNSLT